MSWTVVLELKFLAKKFTFHRNLSNQLAKFSLSFNLSFFYGTCTYGNPLWMNLSFFFQRWKVRVIFHWLSEMKQNNKTWFFLHNKKTWPLYRSCDLSAGRLFLFHPQLLTFPPTHLKIFSFLCNVSIMYKH